MGSPAAGFRVVWDVVPFDGRWVLLPGVALLGLCAGILLLRYGASSEWPTRRRALGVGAVLLWLVAVWWTLGGIGAWRMGVGRLADGTANFVEGPAEVLSRSATAAVVGFQVNGQPFRRSKGAFLPPLHACRWPTPPLLDGQHVRVWFFGDDVLRLDVAEAR